MTTRGTSAGFGPGTHGEGGTRDGRKPLLPHLQDDHGGDVDHVYGTGVGALLDEHKRLHRGETVEGYEYARIVTPLP